MEREDFVNPHAYNMRTDYYVVSPNSRAYTRGRRNLLACACAPGPDYFQYQCKINASVYTGRPSNFTTISNNIY